METDRHDRYRYHHLDCFHTDGCQTHRKPPTHQRPPGRLKVEATFDGEPYRGSVVNMGVKDADGRICYIIGITKAIRKRIGKTFGEQVEVTLQPLAIK